MYFEFIDKKTSAKNDSIILKLSIFKLIMLLILWFFSISNLLFLSSISLTNNKYDKYIKKIIIKKLVILK